MANPYMKQPTKTRMSILIFIKGAAAPLVLYVENPVTVYEELKKIIESGQNKLYEKECNGPIKKVSFMTGQISSIAIQEEPCL